MRASSTETQNAGSISHRCAISMIAGLLSALPSTPAHCISSAAGPR
jgi:nicotinamide mononucleotide (NMN) deamidase PncC